MTKLGDLVSSKRQEYSQILHKRTGIILGREVERPVTGDEFDQYEEFISDVTNNKYLLMELLASSAPENTSGLERLSAARCELQAKVWEADANQTKAMFYLSFYFYGGKLRNDLSSCPCR